MHEDGGDLLERLAHVCGCVYLSDLRGLRLTRARADAALDKIPPGRYPLAQWREAASYVAGTRCIPEDEPSARTSLAEALSRGESG